MKRIPLLPFTILLFIAFFFSSCQEKAPYILKGTALNSTGDSLFVSLPSYGVSFFSTNSMKVPLGENGEFEFVIPASEKGFAKMFHRGTRRYYEFWIQSGVKDSIVIDYEAKEAPLFFGDRAEVLAFEASTERASYFHSNDKVYWQYYKDSVISELQSKIEQKKEDERIALTSFKENGLVSQEHLDAFMINSEYHWKNVISSVYWHHYFYKYELERESIYNDEWDKAFKSLFEGINLNDEDAQFSRYYFDFMKEYAMVTSVWNKVEIDTTLSQKERVDASHNRKIQNIKDLFEGKMEELMWSDYIFNAAIQRRFEKSILDSYDDFVQVYPESEYIKPMVKYMEPIRDYHVKLEQPMSDKIIMIDNAHEYTEFEQIVEPYKGELVFIDMWATWCGPCKIEFEHKEELYEFVDGKSIKLVYLSSDRDKDEEKWKEMVNFYGLEGVNMRISQDLFWKIWKDMLGSEVASIPRYLIVDRDGKLIVEEAAKPSDGQKLYDQLAKYL